MTEIAGEFGSGKSQLCYTLCVTANMARDKEGLGGNVIFIDTETHSGLKEFTRYPRTEESTTQNRH